VAETVLGNYVKLVPGVPKRLRFKECKIVEKTVRDPKLGIILPKRAYVCIVTEEDGRPVNKLFSTLSEKLAIQLEQLRRAGILYDRIIEIVWHPRDYATEYEVRVL